MEHGWTDRLTQPSPVPIGSRVELVSMGDDPCPIPAGTRGTVMEGSNGAQVYVDWDDGRGLMLIPGIDHWCVIQDA